MSGAILAERPGQLMQDMGDGTARVLDLETGTAYPPMLVASLAARGYWQPLAGSQGEALSRWEAVKEAGTVAVAEDWAEELHPRDDHGRFSGTGGGGKAEAATDEVPSFKRGADASKWLRERYPNVEFNLDLVNPKLAGAVAKQFHALGQEWPTVVEQMHYLGTQRPNGSVHGSGAMAWTDGMDITLSRDYFGIGRAADPRDRAFAYKLGNQKIEAAGPPFHAASGVAEVVTHEFGHVLNTYMNSIPEYARPEAKMMARLYDGQRWDTHGVAASDYGRSSPREGFAEAFAQSTLTPPGQWSPVTRWAAGEIGRVRESERAVHAENQRLRATAAQEAGQWAEELHPRGHGGKFAPSGNTKVAGPGREERGANPASTEPHGIAVHAAHTPATTREPTPHEVVSDKFHQWMHQERGGRVAEESANFGATNAVSQRIGKMILSDRSPETRAAVARLTEGAKTPAERARIVTGRVAEYVQTWALTSGDHQPRSLAMQAIISERYGIEPTGHLAANMQSRAAEVQQVIRTEGPMLRAVLNAQYRWTQQELRGAGIDAVTVYRGVGQARPESGRANAMSLQPLSSFTTDYQMARAYSEVRPESGTAHGLSGNRRGPEAAAMIAAQIPRERIFSTARTGFGILSQSEVLVIGGQNLPATVRWGTLHEGGATFPESPAGLVR